MTTFVIPIALIATGLILRFFSQDEKLKKKWIFFIVLGFGILILRIFK